MLFKGYELFTYNLVVCFLILKGFGYNTKQFIEQIEWLKKIGQEKN